MQSTRVGSISLLLLGIILATTAFSNAAPPMAVALVDGRTHDQAHDSGYVDWIGNVQYVYMAHRDSSYLPPEEGSIFCGSGCWEWITRIGNGGTVSGAFDRDVSYFEVMVASSHDGSVGNATLRACSSVRTTDMYGGPGAGLPGFVSLILSVPAGCRSWSLSASGGYIDFRSVDVNYSGLPPTPINTSTLTPTITPSRTSTSTSIPTSTYTLMPTLTFTPTLTPTYTPTFTPTHTPTPTATNTPSPTPTPLPPQIVGQTVCDLSGEAGWCKGNESLELVASDPQGLEVTISGDLNGAPFSCGDSCSVPLPEGIGTANYIVISASGRTANGSSTWQRDSTPPVLNILVPPLDGRNGWYISQVDVSANASDAISGVNSVEGSLDEGVTWNSFPIRISDGVFSVTARARDVAGNETPKTAIVRVDTIPPITQFTAPPNAEVVHGSVLLASHLVDETSGASSGELSLDGGLSWQAASLSANDTLSFAWNTNEVPNGQYTLQMRGLDFAGNLGKADSITLVVDNKPPRVSLMERWWIWESGQLNIAPNHFPIASVKVIISDPQYRWPEVVLNFNPERIPDAISWDRHFADGTLAPSGWYRAVAVACDVHDLCGSDEGIIEIPLVATSTTTLALSPTATLTAVPQATQTATREPITSTPVIAVPSLEITPEPAKPTYSILYLQILGLLGLFLAIASASVVDPRPAALDRLRESIKQISGQKMIDSSKYEQ